MKNNALTITILSAAFLATAGVHGQSTNGQSAPEDLKDAGYKIHEATDDIKDYTFEKKDEFTKKMRGELLELNKSLEHLRAKIDHAGAATKAEAQPKFNALRVKADQLGKKLDGVQDATASTWESVKMDSKKAYRELKVKIHREHQWLSNKTDS
jgi:hypothetical protein